jgi:hypothetical protein
MWQSVLREIPIEKFGEFRKSYSLVHYSSNWILVETNHKQAYYKQR